MKLKYCEYAYRLFEEVITNQYVGDECEPNARLFAQFHAPATDRLKCEILNEIKSKKSRIRVIFATTALGMGIDSPDVINIIHITPPSNLESYVQEIGRADRSGKQSLEKTMKNFCEETSCLRSHLINYFGFPVSSQKICCSNCNETSEPNTCSESLNVTLAGANQIKVNHQNKYNILKLEEKLKIYRINQELDEQCQLLPLYKLCQETCCFVASVF